MSARIAVPESSTSLFTGDLLEESRGFLVPPGLDLEQSARLPSLHPARPDMPPPPCGIEVMETRVGGPSVQTNKLIAKPRSVVNDPTEKRCAHTSRSVHPSRELANVQRRFLLFGLRPKVRVCTCGDLHGRDRVPSTAPDEKDFSPLYSGRHPLLGHPAGSPLLDTLSVQPCSRVVQQPHDHIKVGRLRTGEKPVHDDISYRSSWVSPGQTVIATRIGRSPGP